MPASAFQTRFRMETVAGFEKNKTLLQHTVTTEADIKANKAVFLVADSGNATATTRGLSGLIPSRSDNLNQFTVQMQEWHDKVDRTDFNIYTSQGNGAAIMQQTSRAVLNRKRDEEIVQALSLGALVVPGAAATASLSMVAKAKTMLANNSAGGNEVFAVITPAFHQHLMKLREFTSADWINNKRYEGSDEMDGEQFSWNGVKWIVNQGLPGVGTALSNCYMYNKSAVGHACDSEGLEVAVGYMEEQDYSWARTSAFFGTKILQTSGVVKMVHDDSIALL